MTGNPQPPFELRPMTPRRVRKGIKLRAAGESVRSWPAQRWLALLERMIDASRRATGLEYARSGQTLSMEFTADGVIGRVQGRAPRAYQTQWRIPAIPDDQWQQIFDAMAGEAFYAAKLLAREVPDALETLLTSLGFQLIPVESEVAIECTCPAAGPCKHAATLGYLVAERLDKDPLLAFAMRGMPTERIVERLGTARARHTQVDAAAHAEPIAPPLVEPAKPLQECLGSFWRPGTELGELQRMPPPHHAPHALLRRLGPSPLRGRFPLVGLLASVYDTVAARAIRLRDHAERLDDGAE
jgi:uncharacterized Zn finger protein